VRPSALAVSDEQSALADAIRGFAEHAKLRQVARTGADDSEDRLPECWSAIAGQELLALPWDARVIEVCVAIEQLGHALAPGPVVPTLLAGLLISRYGDADLKTAAEAGARDGSFSAAVSLNGQLFGGAAVSTVVLPIDGEWYAVDAADLELASTLGIDPTRRVAAAARSAVAVAGRALPGLTDAEVIAAAATLLAAEAAGIAAWCVETAVDYAKVREQFGRVIGGFQAVKHHLANMLVGVELATALAWDASRGAASADEAGLAAAAAASFAAPNYREAAQKAIQIFGGIGFTWEHDAHLYLRRAAALAAVIGALGDADGDVSALAAAGVKRQYAVDLPPEAAEYRAQARAFLAGYRQTPQAERRALLAESGYLVPHWPSPFGRAAGPVEQLVIDEELAEVDKPVLGIGGWVLLTLTQTASQEQIDRWVRPSLLGEYYWCQLFSEPNAGSDAAAVQTRGVKVDGGWRVTGQKVWTSGAQHSNRGLATIRTDPAAPKHKGITAMVIDLTDPGVEVRPLREITGEALFNEVFINDVFIPDADVVGAVNDGWRVARATLGNERVTIGGGSRDGVPAAELLELAARYGVSDTEDVRAIGRLLVEEQAMRVINLRQVTRAVIGSGPGPEGNVTKLLSAEHAQRVTELAMRLAGPAAVTGGEERVSFEYLFDRCLSIAGGTSEITRNVIAERILGLPRDPLVR
jgi:3-oxochol-4-en-24-oyl-CoA dehydrogenase